MGISFFFIQWVKLGFPCFYTEKGTEQYMAFSNLKQTFKTTCIRVTFFLVSNALPHHLHITSFNKTRETIREWIFEYIVYSQMVLFPIKLRFYLYIEINKFIVPC